MVLFSNVQNPWKRLGLNVAVMLLIPVTIFCLYFFLYLPWATGHGDPAVIVPDFEGKSVEEVEATCKEYNLEYVISDTSYSAKHTPFTVISQNPKVAAEVKTGRKIYLTLCSEVPEILITETFLNKIHGLPASDVKHALERKGFMVRMEEIDYPYAGIVVACLYKGLDLQDGDAIQKGDLIVVQVGNGKLKVDEPQYETMDSSTSVPTDIMDQYRNEYDIEPIDNFTN